MRIRRREFIGTASAMVAGMATTRLGSSQGGAPPSKVPTRPAKVERLLRYEGEQILPGDATAPANAGGLLLVGMTPAGRKLLGSLRKRKNAYLAKRLRELDPADVEALERAAEVLERMLESERRS